jgi:membrane protein involved in colicin uptake
MKKRYTVLGLSLVLALALAVPALGGPSNPIAGVSASVKSIANKALKKAKTAQSAAEAAQATANSAAGDASTALKTANTAQSTAANALKTANTANSTANTANSTANTAKTAAAAAQSTANGKMSGEVQVEGTEGSGLSIASCPGGKVPTGGGFIITGANNNSATPIESTQYGSSWLVIAEQINGVGGTSWGTVATVNCATSP